MAARDDLPDGLFEDVRNYCDITWEDEGTDRKLLTLIGNGIAYLDGKGASPRTTPPTGSPASSCLTMCATAGTTPLRYLRQTTLRQSLPCSTR